MLVLSRDQQSCSLSRGILILLLYTSTPSTERETCWTALAGQFHLEEEEGLILEIMMEVRHERGRMV